ncbi:hypothetical protein [uncultured Sphingomonas sp.]|uniref:hypothetical protein n=1 Tax=uncultured Sphingomonas sp. TaxID=158754 RepID=UPI003748936B
MKASDLQDRIIAQLLRDHGGTKRRWRTAVGRVKLYDPATHPHCNWSLDPQGNAKENAVIEAMMDDLRLRLRIVTPG